MHRVPVDPARIAADVVELTGDAHRYLARVLRLEPGERVTLFDGAGDEAVATIARIGPRSLELHVLERRRAAPPAGPELVLLQALVKGDKLDLVVQKATELGASRVVLLATARTVQRLDAVRSVPRRARWQKIAREAARQCGRADVPEIDGPIAFEAAVAELPADALKLLFWEESRHASLRDVLRHAAEAPLAKVVLAVGPEGGFTVDEVAVARAAGFHVAGLGPRTLRAETAAVAALAIVGYAVGDLGGRAAASPSPIVDRTEPPDAGAATQAELAADAAAQDGHAKDPAGG